MSWLPILLIVWVLVDVLVVAVVARLARRPATVSGPSSPAHPTPIRARLLRRTRGALH